MSVADCYAPAVPSARYLALRPYASACCVRVRRAYLPARPLRSAKAERGTEDRRRDSRVRGECMCVCVRMREDARARLRA